jgi:hypothetical protein
MLGSLKVRDPLDEASPIVARRPCRISEQPNNSLKLTRRAGASVMLESPASLA